MNLTSFSSAARKFLPPSVFALCRSAGTALLAPFLFGRRTGFFRSAWLNRAVDRKGAPLPWYTYPAVEFLANKDFAGRRILEWGAGQSTHWWAERAAHVTSFESDALWHDKIKPELPPHCSIHLVADDLRDWRHLEGQKFDLIVIDGLDRFKCAVESMGLLLEGGGILLDDAEGFWGDEGTYPILDLYRQNGFRRIDFYGCSAGVIRPHCTSLFFRSDCFLLAGAENPARSDP
jgi:hypothetical protein